LKESRYSCYIMSFSEISKSIIYEYILIKRVTEEVKRMLTAVNMNKVFTQSLILILFYFIEIAKTSLLNIFT